MKQVQFVDKNGSFSIKNPQDVSGLYFPIAADGGLKSSLTPLLGGDTKKDQNTFLLEPVSIENLHNNRSTRNFWCQFKHGAWSATGVSAEQEAARGTEEEESTELTAGFMWHTMRRTSKKYQLQSEITSFVPIECKDTEVMLVTIKNTSSTNPNSHSTNSNSTYPNATCFFTPIVAIPMYGRSADNIRDHRHVTSLLHRTKVTEYGVTITPTLTFDERGHKKNTMTYYVLGEDENGHKPVGMIPVTEDLLGEGGSFTHPEAVYGQRNEANNIGCPRCGQVTPGAEFDGYETIGALVFADCELKAGEEKTFIICLGMDDEVTANSVVEKLNTYQVSDWRASLTATKDYWNKQVNVRFHTGDKQFDSYLCWVAFQPILRRIYGCSFLPHHDYGKGGRGWRDLWQDCLALLLMNPDGVRQMLLDNFNGVRMDGSNATIIGSKQGEFIADRNNITRVWMDHGFWPLHTTAFYIHQTGDLSILLEKAGYFKDRQIIRGEEKDSLWEDGDGICQRATDGTVVQGTILEHILIQNLTAFYDVGEHNRIRLRGADWNDALDMAPERGESVAFTYAYAGNLGALCELLRRLQARGTESVELPKELLVLLSREEELYQNIARKKELLRAYCHSVKHDCSGVKEDIAIKKLIEILRHMESWWKETLRQEEWLAPKTSDESGFFNGYYDNHGRRVESNDEKQLRMMLTGQVFAIMSGTANKEQTLQIVQAADKYLYRKNQGGYCLNTNFHELKDDLGRMFGFAYGQKENGAVFSHMAVMYGNALYQQGFATQGFQSLNSLYQQAANTEVSKIYPGIPEYFNERGRGMYHYLTGAASWYLMTVLTQMFGIHGEFGDLCLQPKLMPEQFDEEGKASASFVYLGRRIKVTYQKTEGTSSKPKKQHISKEEILSWDNKTEHEIVMEVSYEVETH